MDEERVVASLAALAQPVRLKVFRALVVVGRAGLTPSAMAEGLAIPPNTLSFHLKELAHAGLVTVEPQGRNLIYRADYSRMDSVIAYLTKHCCSGTATSGTKAAATT